VIVESSSGDFLQVRLSSEFPLDGQYYLSPARPADDGRRRILVVTDRYVPEVSAASTRLHAHATRWIKSGHDVHVLTCVPNFPRGVPFPGYRNNWHQSEVIDGVTVHRVKTYMAPNTGKYKRALDYFSFPVSARLMAGRIPVPDVILASSPPITVALAAQLLARHYDKPWVFEVRDLWPASIRAVGAAKGGLLNLVEKYELGLYRKAAATIVLTDSFFKDITTRGIPAEKIRVVTNGVDLAPFRAAPHKWAARTELKIASDKFLVGFVGTVGLAQGAATFAKAAGRLRDRSDIRFVCWGEGADRPKVMNMVAEMELKNIEFRDFLPAEKVPTILAALDVGTVLLKNDPLFETVIPSKIFELLAAGLPIAACVGGEARRLVQESGAGECVDPEDDAGLARLIGNYAQNSAATADRARAGRAFIEGAYSRDSLAGDALAVLLDVARAPVSRSCSGAV
jgi:colanic acid biosynthesis glycosyl transferase WcaI